MAGWSTPPASPGRTGLKDENGQLFEPSELKDWRGERAQAGRIVPRGWAKSGKFARELSQQTGLTTCPVPKWDSGNVCSL